MPRNPVISVRLSDLTRHQIDELTVKWGCSMADVITILIDRQHQREIEAPKYLINQEWAQDIDAQSVISSL